MQLLRKTQDGIFFEEKYRTFVLVPEQNKVFEINYNSKPNKWYDWNDFLDSEERFANLEKNGEWSDAGLIRAYHQKGIDDFMSGNIYTKYTKYTDSTLQKIKDLPYTIFDANYRKKRLHKCPFHNDSTASMSIRGKFWKCFGCNEGGSIIDFYMLLHHVNFKDAVNNLRTYL